MKKLLSFCSLLLAFLPLDLMAQQAENQDLMRTSGKIYVVVGVIGIIFIGIVLFLFTLERRLAQLEKINNEK